MAVTFVRLLGVCLVTSTAWLGAAGPDLRLVNAAEAQDAAAIRALLKERVDVNAARADGATALLWATHWNDFETVDLLIAAGARINAADDHGVTPLMLASENVSVAMVERLLKAGASSNGLQSSGLTPLVVAARAGSLGIAKALLAAGANVHAATSESGYTAMMWAVADRNLEVARLLVANHADVHASSAKGFTPLLFAARNGDVEMAKVLIAAGVNVNETGSDGTHALVYSIVSGQDQFPLFLLEQGADPNASIDGVRALHAAAGNVTLWLEDWNRKHLGVAAYSAGMGTGYGGAGLDPGRRLVIVKALLAKGADPDAGIGHSTMFMSYIGRPTKGAFEPFACGTGDVRGATPLWVAAYTANGGVGGFGGDGGANVVPGLPGRGNAGARFEGPGEILKALLAAGADAGRPTVDGTTPLMVAAGLGRATFSPGKQRGDPAPVAEAAVRILLDAGADVNAVNEADFTALHGAAFRGLNEVIQILVERGARLNARDYRGRTPFRLAEGSKQSFQFQAFPQTAAFLRELGADITLGIPGTVQERMRDVPVGNQQQP